MRNCWRWGREKEISGFPASAVSGRGLGARVAGITWRRTACWAPCPPWPASASAGVTTPVPGTGSPCTVTLSADPPEARLGPQPGRRSPSPSLRSPVPTCLPLGRRSREPGTRANSAPQPTRRPVCVPFVHQPRNLFLRGSTVCHKDPAPAAPGSQLLSLHAARGDLTDFPRAMEPATLPGTGPRCVRAGAGGRGGGRWRPARAAGPPGGRAAGSGSRAASRSSPAWGAGGGGWGSGAGARVAAFQGEGVVAGRPQPTWGPMAGPALGRREPAGGSAKLAAQTPVFHVHFSSIFLPVHCWVPLTEH